MLSRIFRAHRGSPVIGLTSFNHPIFRSFASATLAGDLYRSWEVEKDYKKCLQLYHNWDRKHEGNQIFKTLLFAANQVRDHKQISTLWAEMDQLGIVPTQHSVSFIISALTQRRNMSRSVALLRALELKPVRQSSRAQSNKWLPGLINLLINVQVSRLNTIHCTRLLNLFEDNPECTMRVSVTPFYGTAQQYIFGPIILFNVIN